MFHKLLKLYLSYTKLLVFSSKPVLSTAFPISVDGSSILLVAQTRMLRTILDLPLYLISQIWSTINSAVCISQEHIQNLITSTPINLVQAVIVLQWHPHYIHCLCWAQRCAIQVPFPGRTCCPPVGSVISREPLDINSFGVCFSCREPHHPLHSKHTGLPAFSQADRQKVASEPLYLLISLLNHSSLRYPLYWFPRAAMKNSTSLVA